MSLILRAAAAFSLSLFVLNSHGLAQSPELHALRADLQAAKPKERLASQIAGLWQRAHEQERGR